MSQKSIFIGIIIILVVGVAGYFAFVKNQTPTPQVQQTVFASQEECEQTTGKSCSFQMCDYVPPGKTFEEVCGKNFKKGWVANPAASSSPSPSNSQPVKTPSHQGVIIEATLEINAPFSTAKLVIFADGSALYTAKQSGQAEIQTIHEAGTFTKAQMAELFNLIENNNFFSLKNRPYKDSDPLDGSTYALTIKIRPTGPPELVDAAVHQVSCYQFSCEQKFLIIKNFIMQSYGKEILEVGV